MAQYVMDYDLARKHYAQTHWDAEGEFGPAFLITNEMLSKSLTLFPAYFDDVLTVAASGDQAMHYAMHGAKHIDTFDQTFAAKAIMDVKVAAVRQMPRWKYVEFLDNLYREQRKGKNLLSVDGMGRVMECVPKDSAEFIYKLADCRIFGRGYPPLVGQGYIPSADEYAKMQEKVSGPYNFIWSDITDLHTHLTQKYDVINVSNIFEWVVDKDVCLAIVKNLFQFLKPKGYIFAIAYDGNGFTRLLFTVALQQLKNAQLDFTYKVVREGVIILRRLR